MNCKWCNKELSKVQVYAYLRGSTKGTACSSYCSQKIKIYGNKENELKKDLKICSVCGKEYYSKIRKRKVCGIDCQAVLSSRRMKITNPMFIKKNREKASSSQIRVGNKPSILGGNGRGATIQQLILYNELIKYNDSFQMEFIEKTNDYKKSYNVPTHFKIDIGSKELMIAIEIDGSSHNSLKVKECDKRKEIVLGLLKWKVLRFTNSQIEKELKSCVQTVLSMI
jgi:hypothetical protein